LQKSVSGSGATLTLNVTTTAPHQLARQDTPSFGVSSKLALAGMLVLFLPAFRRRRKYFVCLIAMVLTLSLAACGGGGSGGGGGGGKTDAGTALGTYSFTVTATTGSGASLDSTTAPLSVTVN
jgi:MYXO-CTERM domain-containing protein